MSQNYKFKLKIPTELSKVSSKVYQITNLNLQQQGQSQFQTSYTRDRSLSKTQYSPTVFKTIPQFFNPANNPRNTFTMNQQHPRFQKFRSYRKRKMYIKQNKRRSLIKMNKKQKKVLYSILQNQIDSANRDFQKFNDFVKIIDERLS